MKHLFNRRLLALALSLLGSASAQAASWSLTNNGSALDFIEQSANVGEANAGLSVAAALQDLSGSGYALLSDAAVSDAAVGGLSIERSYAHLLAVDTAGGSSSAQIDLSLSHSWAASATAAAQVSDFSLTQDLALSSLSLTIVGDAGETVGSQVVVTFTGSASALLSGLPGASELGLGFEIARAVDGYTLASYANGWTASGDDPTVSVSFVAAVGDVLNLTLWGHQQTTQAAGVPVVLNSGDALAIEGTALLQGQLAVAAVPEPSTYALWLAGAGVLGGWVRRRQAGTAARG